MYEYKVVEANNSKEAERLMNKYAADGWRVISSVSWNNFKALLIITLEREKQ